MSVLFESNCKLHLGLFFFHMQLYTNNLVKISVIKRDVLFIYITVSLGIIDNIDYLATFCVVRCFYLKKNVQITITENII